MKFSSITEGADFALLDKKYELYKPDYKRNICQVMPSAARVLFPDNDNFPDSLDFKKNGEHDIIVNFLVDSMGSWQIDTLVNTSGCIEDFSSIIDQHISSVFPTITSACVLSYHTGLAPARHGVLNHRLYMEELDNIIDTLALKTINSRIHNVKEPLHSAGINVSSWLLSPAKVYPVLESQATHVHISPWAINGNGLSRFYTTDQPNEHFLGRGSVLTAFALVNRLIQKHEEGKKTFVNVYLGEIDHACHDYGPVSEMVQLELEHFIRGFSWLLKQVSSANSRVFFTITADHGQATISPQPEDTIILKPEEFVNAKRVFKSGRTIQFHARDSCQDELYDELQEQFAGKGLVITGNTILELTGAFTNSKTINASFKNKILSRMGDHLVLLAGGYNAEMEREKTDKAGKKHLLEFRFNGQHGSLTEKELVVPLIAGGASDLHEKLINLYEKL
ncbi:MAG: alkaline phosphatase family protein [Candidatus Odinarchaeota archaeon]